MAIAIKQILPEYFSYEQLRAKTDEFKSRLAGIEELDVLKKDGDERLVEAFAVVREASVRTTGLRHYDVQLIGGMVLHQGRIAEMKTGEGKTLVASLPLYLNGLTGRGVHLVTPNDYLSKFGVQQMGPIYHALGMTVAVIQSKGGSPDPDAGSFVYDPNYQSADSRYQNLRPASRRACYDADITYGTNNEYGFDYLRDNMVVELDQMVQRQELYYAIVDEVDNILIDIGMERIAEEGYNLNISRYISTAVGEEEIDLMATHSDLVDIEQQIRKATATHNTFLKELGLPLLPGADVAVEVERMPRPASAAAQMRRLRRMRANNFD